MEGVSRGRIEKEGDRGRNRGWEGRRSSVREGSREGEKGVERVERERREWRGRERSGEDGEGEKGVERVEREGREWRGGRGREGRGGREGAGKMKEEKSEGEACM